MGSFSRNFGTSKDQTNTSPVYLGPNSYCTTVGKFARKASIKGGSFSALPNINSTEAAYRKGLKTGGPSFFKAKRNRRCLVNYSICESDVGVVKNSLTPGPTTYSPNSYGSFGTKGGFKIQEETSLTTKVKQMKRLLENPKEYYNELEKSKEYSENEKFKRPSKLVILQSALKRCNMEILEQIEIARSKEVQRRESRAQLLSTFPYSKKLEYRERELSQKHDADRKITEKQITDLLRKQKQLEKGCEKLIEAETITGAKIVEDINNKTSTFAIDLKRWLQDMNIQEGFLEESSEKCLENTDTVVAESNSNVDTVAVGNSHCTDTNTGDMEPECLFEKVVKDHGGVLWPTLSPVR